jgi:parallel beta-helix repeat protein
MRKRIALSIVSMVALGAMARADEGRIPLLALPGPPYVISQPGHYLLTASTGNTTGEVVRITSSGVTLDLGGHTLSGPSSYITPAITIDVTTGVQEITIRNGRIFGGSQGVVASNPNRPRIRLERLDVSGALQGLAGIAEWVDVIECRVHDLVSVGGSAGAGINFDALGGRILDNLIQNVTGSGITAFGFRGGEIRRNVVRNFGGFLPNGVGINLEDSVMFGNTGGAVIADNVVTSLPSGTDDSGIRVRSLDNLIAGNVVTRNGLDGIQVLSAANRIERNLVNENGDDGIVLGLIAVRTHLEANQVQSNADCGLELNSSPGGIYRNNSFAANPGGNACGGGTAVNAGGNYCDAALCP